MKRLLIVAATALSSCGPTKQDLLDMEGLKPIHGLPEGNYIKVIDSCEYIVTNGNRENTMVHKGNCKNPIHKK